MGDCYVLCRRPGVIWTVLLHIVRDVSSCLSLWDVARRRSRRTRSPSGSGRQYLGEVLTGPSFEGQGDQWYCSVSSAQEELRCCPGVEGRYLTQALHLHAPLPEGPGAQVPRNLPPGPRIGGAGPGLTLAILPGIPSLPGLMTDR